MKNKNTLFLLILIACIGITGILSYSSWSKKSQESGKQQEQEAVSLENQVGTKMPVKNNEVSTSLSVGDPISYAYLFDESAADQKTSNIIGYFGGGAFFWYVPNWIYLNWEMDKDAKAPGIAMSFKPKRVERVGDISSIIFSVATSTEVHNAEYLAAQQVAQTSKDKILVDEKILSSDLRETTSLQMRAVLDFNTIIYHVQVQDGNRIFDTYYIDGVGKTLTLTFDADQSVFAQFANMIRSLAGSISRMEKPRG